MNHKTYKNVLSPFFFILSLKQRAKNVQYILLRFVIHLLLTELTRVFFVIKLEYKDKDKP